MKILTRISALICLFVAFGTQMTSAQIWTTGGAVNNSFSLFTGINNPTPFAPLDVVGTNILLRPSSTFNPNGKFCGIGESGGVVGPVNGCDIYGFRAQVNESSFINMGLRKIKTFTYDNVPTISWGSFDNVDMTSYPKPLDFLYNLGVSNGCGSLIARMSGIGYAFTVYGSALASGGSWVNSDARFKTDIQPIGSALDLIGQLEGTTYLMNRDAFPERRFNEGLQYGFIAQDLQKVMPTAVMEDEEGYLGVNYDAVIPILVEGVKELETRMEGELEEAKATNTSLNQIIEEQQAVMAQQDLAIRQLQEEMRALRQEVKGEAVQGVEVPKETGQLFQNRPNPFRESTTINYYLPNDVAQATLVVFNSNGVEVMSFNRLDRGYGNVVIEGGSLESGTYIYRLMADGKVIGSQSMILSK